MLSQSSSKMYLSFLSFLYNGLKSSVQTLPYVSLMACYCTCSSCTMASDLSAKSPSVSSMTFHCTCSSCTMVSSHSVETLLYVKFIDCLLYLSFLYNSQVILLKPPLRQFHGLSLYSTCLSRTMVSRLSVEILISVSSMAFDCTCPSGTMSLSPSDLSSCFLSSTSP